MKKNITDWQALEGETLLIDKPYGWSSFAIISQLRKWLHAKIGHAGTLDPLASGLMICCTGKSTKKLSGLIGLPKEYLAIIRLGASTPTYDLESEPEAFADISTISHEKIENAINTFRGNIQQLPPIHSAIKQAGKPLYKLARKGVEIEVKPRQVLISEFEITKIDLPEVHVRIRCSSGTYIRSLAYDLGQLLGCGGFLQALRRTAIDEFRIEEAYTIDELSAHFGSKMNTRIIEPKIDYGLPNWT